MNINATLINYLHICHRKLWLHANGITMEHTSDIGGHQKVWGKIFLMYLIKKLSGSSGYLKMIL